LSMTLTQQTSKKLRDLVASAIAGEKAYDVPAVCQRYGLASGTDEEAFRSKFRYVSSRLQRLSTKHVLEIAQRIQNDMPTFELGELLLLITEQDGPRITELTRRRVVEALQGIPLAGKLPELEFFEKVWPLEKMPSSLGLMAHSMRDMLIRHRVRNEDLDNELLKMLGIYTCAQATFIHFLETLTHPLTRETPDQYDLVARINRHLRQDGFELREEGRISGSPRFAVKRLTDGTTPADQEISKALAAFNPAEIHTRWEEALKRRTGDPRAAITLARTLLEDTCKWILHEADKNFKEDDDLPVLYRALAKFLKLAPDEHTEQVFKQILGSCQSIVESLGTIRNKLGDAHSQGPRRPARPHTRHAELAVNLAGTMATFLIATWEARSSPREE
jgi:hypothetical protein